MNYYEPTSGLIQEDQCDTLLLYLPGFTKEQLRVQLTSTGRRLRISGARPFGENKRSSFQKNFSVSPNSDTSKISAKFVGEILYVRQPKLIVPAENEDKKIPPPRTVRPPTPAVQPPAPKVDQLPHPEKTTPSNDQYKAPGVEDFPSKYDEIKDKESPKEAEKSAEMEDGKKDEKMYEQDKTDRVDYGQQVTGRTTSDQRENGGRNVDAHMADKGTKYQEKGKKVSGTTDVNSAHKGTKYHDIDGVEDYNLNAGSPAAILKITGRMITTVLVVLFAFLLVMITTVLVVLFAFLLGMHASNLPWFSKNPGN